MPWDVYFGGFVGVAGAPATAVQASSRSIRKNQAIARTLNSLPMQHTNTYAYTRAAAGSEGAHVQPGRREA
jgi:hypothetical protein